MAEIEKEPLQNECAFNRKNLIQSLRGGMSKTMKILYTAELVLAVLIIAGSLIFIKDSIKWLAVFCGVVVLLLLAYTVLLMPGMVAKKQMARIKELFHCNGYDTSTEFTPEAVNSYNRTIGQNISVGYAAIRRVVETKNLILLITKEKQMLLLDKERFVNGTAEEFWHFIFDKCPTAKMKRKKAK